MKMKRNVLLSDSEDDWNQSLDSIRNIFHQKNSATFKLFSEKNFSRSKNFRKRLKDSSLRIFNDDVSEWHFDFEFSTV